MKSFCNAVLAALVATNPLLASAQDASAPPQLSIELNAVDTIGESCRLTFLLTNSMATDIDKFVAETVLFSDQGTVELLTLFDFAALPKGRARVRQFQVPDVSCDRLGMVLFNGADTCDGTDHTATSCTAALRLTSRTKIELAG